MSSSTIIKKGKAFGRPSIGNRAAMNIMAVLGAMYSPPIKPRATKKATKSLIQRKAKRKHQQAQRKANRK